MCRNIVINEHARFEYAQKSTAVRFLSMLPAARGEGGVLLARLDGFAFLILILIMLVSISRS